MGKAISCIFFKYGTKIYISSEIYPPFSVTVLFLVKSGSMIIDKSENRWPNSFCEIPCFSSNYKVNQEVLNNCVLCFFHPIFRFWFLVTFGDKVMKILPNFCLHSARQDGQDGKKQKENHAIKVTKIPKTKRQKYGMN